MAKLGDTVTFHTVDGPRVAIVTGKGHDGDNDTFLAVFRGPGDESATGLTADVNMRWSHEDKQPGGFSG
jgi:hypothetical protein